MAVAPLTGHLDAANSQFAKQYHNNALIADLVAPRVGVQKQTDKYYIFDKETMRRHKTKRAPGDPARQIRRTLSTDSYFCESNAQEDKLPQEYKASLEENPAVAAVLVQGRTKSLMDIILLEKEVEIAGKLTDSAVITNKVTLAGGDKFSDLANSDPIGVVEQGKSSLRKIGKEANTAIIPVPVYEILIKHPAILERYKFTKPGAIGLAEIAAVLNIQNVHLAAGVYFDGNDVPQWIWGKHMVIGFVDPSANLEDLSMAKTFVWENGPGTIGGVGTIIGMDPRPSAKTELVSVDMYYDQKITASEAAFLIENAVA